MTRNESRNVAKQAWRYFLRTGNRVVTIGRYNAMVCMPSTGDYVSVTRDDGHVSREAVYASWH